MYVILNSKKYLGSGVVMLIIVRTQFLTITILSRKKILLYTSSYIALDTDSPWLAQLSLI